MHTFKYFLFIANSYINKVTYMLSNKNKRLKTPVILLQNILNKACKVTLQVSASTRETEGNTNTFMHLKKVTKLWEIILKAPRSGQDTPVH